MFKLTGTIKVINDTVQVSEKFSKREFVLTDDSTQYPQAILFQLAQDKCSMLDPFMEGQSVEVSFNLRGREWTSPTGEVKYFNTLDAWRVEATTSSAPAPIAQPAAAVVTEDDSEDLPF